MTVFISSYHVPYQYVCIANWALARAPDLHSNTHQIIKSSNANNSTEHPIEGFKRTHLPDELSARAQGIRALKHRNISCYF